MKKVILVGDIPMDAQIEKVFKEQNVEVVNNLEIKNSMRKQYLQTFEDLEPILKFSETAFYEKPKSKYHK